MAEIRPALRMSNGSAQSCPKRWVATFGPHENAINYGGAMDKPASQVRIELTDDQRKQIREVSGKEVAVLEVTVTELEERVAPVSLSFGQTSHTYTQQG